MRIDFDTSNETELTAVFVMLAVLRGGDLSLPLLGEENDGDSEAETISPVRPEGHPLPPIAPAAVPLPAVPAAPAAAVPTRIGGDTYTSDITAPVNLDSDGLPWDNRIHSTPASKKKDGRWRGKRGLDETTRATVTAELKQVMAAGATPAPPAAVVPPPMFEEAAPGVPLPPTPSEPPVDAATAFGVAAATVVPSAPPAPAVPPAPVVPAAPAADAPATDFAGLMRKITGLQSAGKLTVEDTTQIATSLGITGVRDLMHRPDLIPSFDALLPIAG